MNNALIIENLNAFYGQAQALFDLSFSLSQGEILVLQGLNGAGKSTTLKSIMHLCSRSAEALTFNGVNLANLSTEKIAQLGIAYVPEERRLFPEMSVLDNCLVAQSAAGKRPALFALADIFALFPALAPLAKREAATLSGGEQRMLAISRALMQQPSLLLLDEPCEGVAPMIAQSIARAVKQIAAQGVGVLISESHEGFASELQAQTLKLANGELI